MGVLKTQLIQALTPTLITNAARLKVLCALIEAIIRNKTVNLTVLATLNDGQNCSNESRHRRFQDFFFGGVLALSDVSISILKRLPKLDDGYILAMYRTNWQFGRKHIHFLVVAVIIGKISISLAWKILPIKTRQGNSNAEQRMNLMKKLLQLRPSSSIYAITMDREPKRSGDRQPKAA